MERLQQRLEQAQNALKKLYDVLHVPESEIQRDAAIQRFEFTTEAVWKLVQLFLSELHGLAHNSPKTVMRACFTVGLLDESQVSQALSLIDDRNLTAHTYNEALSETIYARLPAHVRLFSILCDAISAALDHN
jgi:nucleotidyltransferase substrate binding protein (TIGR01987 family)